MTKTPGTPADVHGEERAAVMELLARTCSTERMNVERIAARAFVILGGLFWAFAAFSGTHWTGFADDFNELTPTKAIIVLVITAGIFLLGMYYEVLTGILLFAGAAASIIWGLVAGWEPGVWFIMLVVLTIPMIIAGMLYMFASNMQRICTMDGHMV